MVCNEKRISLREHWYRIWLLLAMVRLIGGDVDVKLQTESIGNNLFAEAMADEVYMVGKSSFVKCGHCKTHDTFLDLRRIVVG